MENVQSNEVDEGWPSSNYPIFLALVLLAATAVTLALGEEKQAEELAIYAYYLLVIGVGIRFFELSLPEDTQARLGVLKGRFLGWMLVVAQRLWAIMKKIGPQLREAERKIPDFGSRVKLPDVRLPEVTISDEHREGLKNGLSYVSDVAKNVTVFLSLVFLIFLIYGLMIDWWTAKGYFSNLVFYILGFFVLYFFTNQMAGRMGGK